MKNTITIGAVVALAVVLTTGYGYGDKKPPVTKPPKTTTTTEVVTTTTETIPEETTTTTAPPVTVTIPEEVVEEVPVELGEPPQVLENENPLEFDTIEPITPVSEGHQISFAG